MKLKQKNSKEVSSSSGSNFISSFGFLSEEKRDAMTTIYAYCRITDDIVDLAQDPGSGVSENDVLRNIDQWEKETYACFNGSSGISSNPVINELSQVIRRFTIPKEYFKKLIEGVKMDLNKKTYVSFDELYEYCFRVASVVGLMCLEIFGYKNEKTKDYARDLGVAFQLTNILRDIKTDGARGRIYIPEDDIRKFGMNRERFLVLLDTPQKKIEDISHLKELIGFEIQRAEHYYESAKSHLTAEDRPSMVAAEVMSSVYFSILRKIKKNPLSVMQHKVRLSKLETKIRAFQGWTKNRLSL